MGAVPLTALRFVADSYRFYSVDVFPIPPFPLLNPFTTYYPSIALFSFLSSIKFF